MYVKILRNDTKTYADLQTVIENPTATPLLGVTKKNS